MRTVTISIVSHGHAAMLPLLLADIAACPEVARVILTLNIPEQDFAISQSEQLLIISNVKPKGFGANHNAAFFQHTRTPYFVVLNPDIRIPDNVFPSLIQCLEKEDVALVAPRVLSPLGLVEDSARRFPSPVGLALKALGLDDGHLEYRGKEPCITVPWVAGMFMMLRSIDFKATHGFDEGYFMYYEDVDLCTRLWSARRGVHLQHFVSVVHDARRASRHDLRHMTWHLVSMVRYFAKHFSRLPKVFS